MGNQTNWDWNMLEKMGVEHETPIGMWKKWAGTCWKLWNGRGVKFKDFKGAKRTRGQRGQGHEDKDTRMETEGRAAKPRNRHASVFARCKAHPARNMLKSVEISWSDAHSCLHVTAFRSCGASPTSFSTVPRMMTTWVQARPIFSNEKPSADKWTYGEHMVNIRVRQAPGKWCPNKISNWDAEWARLKTTNGHNHSIIMVQTILAELGFSQSWPIHFLHINVPLKSDGYCSSNVQIIN